MAAQENPTPLRQEKVAVIGSGLIGRSWSMLFACGGYQVALFDAEAEQVTCALKDIREQLQRLASSGLQRGSLTPEDQFSRITASASLEACVHGAIYVQECIPENKDLKRKLFSELDKMISDKAIVGSSTSSMMPSVMFDHLSHRDRFVVAHPVNPPFYLPLVEIAGAPWTSREALTFTEKLMTTVGQDPVVLNKEVDGFVMGRLQFAIQAEQYALIKEGYVSVTDAEKAMAESVGLWYAFMGPFQAEHINSDGFEDCVKRYSDMVFKVQQTLRPPERMSGDTVAMISAELEKEFCPLDRLDDRRRWRDERLAALARLKRELGGQ